MVKKWPCCAELAGFTTVLVVIARLCTSAALAMLQIFTLELFPTVARATGLGICMVAGCTGSLVVPIVLDLVKYRSDQIVSISIRYDNIVRYR